MLNIALLIYNQYEWPHYRTYTICPQILNTMPSMDHMHVYIVVYNVYIQRIHMYTNIQSHRNDHWCYLQQGKNHYTYIIQIYMHIT